MKTITDVENVVSVLNEEQKQVLKDCINFGFWGDADYEFLDEKGNLETVMMDGYCTNDAKKGKHFTGRKISALFRGIYHRLCSKEQGHQIGHVISHCSDWWGDGTGDMLFIREEYVEAFEQWAKLGKIWKFGMQQLKK